MLALSETFSSIPVWIRFPNLWVPFWTPKIISKLANTVGQPCAMDENTATFGRTSYARCLVEITANQEPPKVARALLSDGTILNENVE